MLKHFIVLLVDLWLWGTEFWSCGPNFQYIHSMDYLEHHNFKIKVIFVIIYIRVDKYTCCIIKVMVKSECCTFRTSLDLNFMSLCYSIQGVTLLLLVLHIKEMKGKSRVLVGSNATAFSAFVIHVLLPVCPCDHLSTVRLMWSKYKW